uniref:Uncharacterized protein n=3 Tax=Photinus pyralis TaxID=7054 RepID=A0A1Y1NBQ7_PHOPY
MAQSNMFLLCVFVVVIFLTTVQTKRYRQLHPPREFQELELGVTRGFGKRALGMHILQNRQKSPPDRELVGRALRGLQEMNIPVARGFGKRNTNVGDTDAESLRQFLEDWAELKLRLKNVNVSQQKLGIPFVNN